MLLLQKLECSFSSSRKQSKFWLSSSQGKTLKLFKSIFAGMSPKLSFNDEKPGISICVSQYPNAKEGSAIVNPVQSFSIEFLTLFTLTSLLLSCPRGSTKHTDTNFNFLFFRRIEFIFSRNI